MEALIVSTRLEQLYVKGVRVNVKKGEYVVSFTNNDERMLKVGNYFDLRKGEISLCPKGKVQEVTENGKWMRKNRVVVRPSKFFGLLDYDITCLEMSVGDDGVAYMATNDSVRNRAYEVMTGMVVSDGLENEVRVSGEISKVYGMRQAEENESGTLANSCMRRDSGYECKKYASFYDGLPGLKVMYATNDEGELIARALLWRCEEGMFLDRVYANNEMQSLFGGIADKRGWLSRAFNSCKHNLTFHVNRRKVNLERRGEEGTPYVDSLCVLDTYENTLSTDGDGVALTECNGRALNSGVECCECGSDIDEDDAYYNDNGEAYCESCWHDTYTSCNNCGDTICLDHAMEGSDGMYYCSYCWERRFVRCERCGDAIRMGDECATHDGDFVCETCLDREYRECEECGEYFLRNEVEEVECGVYLCEICKEDREEKEKEREEVENEC